MTRKFLTALGIDGWRRLLGTVTAGKEVSCMKTYDVRVCSPMIFTIEAENEEEAKRTATERYKQEHDTWIDPEVHDIHACLIP